MLPTITSRCRSLVLVTPTESAVAEFLTTRCGVPEEAAHSAARASQGHIGRARALALDPAANNRRLEVTRIPAVLTDLRACLNAAAKIADLAKEEITGEVEAAYDRDIEALQSLMGSDPKARSSRAYKAALKEITEVKKQRERRRTNDVVDRCLMDLVSVYRDVIAAQTGARGALVNAELGADVNLLAGRTTPESNLHRIDAIFEARQQILEFNTPPLLGLESMMMGLKA